MKIYADNSATTKLAPEALEAMMPFLTEAYGNASGLYSFASVSKKALADARKTIADCIGALPEEIFFTSGGTESDNWAIKGRMRLGRILTTRIEHHAVLNSLAFCEKYPGAGRAGMLPVNRQGLLSLRTLEKNLSRRVSLVSVMFANNEIGTVEPVGEIAELTHRYGAVFHTDAVQAAGHIPINVHELGIDLLSASAHKFHGPKGIGFLYCRNNVPLENFMNGGQQESGFRAGTENIASIVGMAAALKISCDTMTETVRRLKKMTDEFYGIIKNAIPDAVFNGSPDNRLPGHISLSIPGIAGEGLLHFLDLKGTAVSTGAACNSKSTEISHVLTAIRLPLALAKGTVRITFGSDNKDGDAVAVARQILDYCSKGRRRRQAAETGSSFSGRHYG